MAVVIDIAAGGSAQLALYDVNYAFLAESANPLRAQLASGRYRVRIRTGDASTVEEIDVPTEGADVHYVFEAPVQAPPGVEAGPWEPTMEQLIASEAHTRRMCDCVTSGIAVVIYRATFAADLMELYARFIETYGLAEAEGDTLLAAAEAVVDYDHDLVVLFKKVDSHVALWQRTATGRRSMTIPVFDGFVTQVTLPLTEQRKPEERVVDGLNGATIAVLPWDKVAPSLLQRQHAAVQAVRGGHYVTGWVNEESEAVEAVARRMPLLALLELAAWTRLQLSDVERTRVFGLLRGVVSALKTPLTDLKVLTRCLNADEDTDIIVGAYHQDAPPLLSLSWNLLAAELGANHAAMQYLPDNALVDLTSAWLTWTTSASAVKIAELKGASRSYTIKELRQSTQLSSTRAVRSHEQQSRRASKQNPKLLAMRRQMFLMSGTPGTLLPSLLATTPNQVRRNLVSTTSKTSRPSAQPVTLGQVKEWLTMLVTSDELRSVLDKIYARAKSSKFGPFTEPAFRHFLGTLDPLLDRFMVDTYGAEELVQRVLASLPITPEQIAAQFVALMSATERRTPGKNAKPAIERRHQPKVSKVPQTGKIQRLIERKLREQAIPPEPQTTWIPKH